MKILFIINQASGNNTTNWQSFIEDYFRGKDHPIKIINLEGLFSVDSLKKEVAGFDPQRVVAVGGDGTVKLVASCLLQSGIPLGILPAGSANGMAKELGIPADATASLELVLNGQIKSIHLVKINEELCIHLGDIGFNAFVIKKFETQAHRGMWGYIKASWKVLWEQPRMMVELHVNDTIVKRSAAMIVIANATRYGSGAIINPGGDLSDELFEVIVVKKISISEIYKMMVTHLSYDPAKTEVYQVRSLHIKSKIKAHFQVDGEYLGKIKEVNASLIPAAINMIIPG